MKLLTLPLLILSLVTSLTIGQAVTLTGTWYLVDSAGENTLSTTTADTNTIAVSQPTSTAALDRGAVTYLGSAVSLSAVGDFIQFSGDYSGDVGNNVNEAIRIGFYNSNSSPVSSNFSAASSDWIGLWAASGNRSSTGARSNNYYQPSNADLVLDMGDTTPEAAIGTNATDISTGNRTITFRITKTSTTELTLRILSGDVDHTDTLAIATAPATTFDALAVSWKIGSTSGARAAQFDNILVTTVPEPATYAIIAGLGAMALVCWRRRRA